MGIPKWKDRKPGIMGGDDGLKMFALEYGFISVCVILTYEDMNIGIRGPQG